MNYFLQGDESHVRPSTGIKLRVLVLCMEIKLNANSNR